VSLLLGQVAVYKLIIGRFNFFPALKVLKLGLYCVCGIP